MAAYSTYTDQELFDLLQQDDVAALTEIHARYNALLYAHAYKRYPYREEVRDILQDLFIYLWDNRHHLLLTVGLPAYLYSSIRNRLLSHYRKQKVRVEYATSLQSFIDAGENVTEDSYREKELLDIISREIAALPPQMRLIFELSRNQNMTHQEIADKLGLSHHTVRTQVRSALRILRLKMGANIFLILF